jgi:hypoxia-inducible factor (prolyl hydroxylase)
MPVPDETAQRFGAGVASVLRVQLGQLRLQSSGFLRRGDLEQHVKTETLCEGLRCRMREAAATYGLNEPPEAAALGDAAAGPCSDLLARVAAELPRRGFCFLDGFLAPALAERVREEVLAMDAAGELQPGEIEGGQAESLRGDRVGHFNEAANERLPACTEFLSQVDRFVVQLGESVQELRGVGMSRQTAMVAVYPKAGARYKRHVDNPDQNGRKLTVILYLNPSWELACGGELRIFRQVPGEEAAEEVAETVEPLHSRLLVFWSDERCPHEVAAVKDGGGPRLAITTWYFDNAELAASIAHERALKDAVAQWADRRLCWDAQAWSEHGGRATEYRARASFAIDYEKQQRQQAKTDGATCSDGSDDSRGGGGGGGRHFSVHPNAPWWRAGLVESFTRSLSRARLMPPQWRDITTSASGCGAVGTGGSAHLLLKAAMVTAHTAAEPQPQPHTQMQTPEPEGRDVLATGAAAALQHSLKWIAGDLPQLLLTIGPVPTTAKPASCFLEPRCVRLRLRPAAAAADGHCDSDDGDSEDSAGAADSALCVQLPCVVDVEGVNVVMWSRRSRRLRLRLRPLNATLLTQARLGPSLHRKSSATVRVSTR